VDYYQKLAKVAVVIGTVISFAAALKANPASAADFSFTQGDYTNNGSSSGNFSGLDTNEDGAIDLNELSAFSATYASSVISPTTFDSLHNLSSFSYVLNTNDLTFSATQSGVPAPPPQLSLSSSAGNYLYYDPNAGLPGGAYRSEATTSAPIITAVSQPTTSGPMVTTVPEPTNVMGVVLVGLGGLGSLLKLSITSQKTEK